MAVGRRVVVVLVLLVAVLTGCAGINRRQATAMSLASEPCRVRPHVYQLPGMRPDKRLRLCEIVMPGVYLVFVPLVQAMDHATAEEEDEGRK